MTINPNDLNLHSLCDICKERPATEIKGGINFKTGCRGLWFCCRECQQHIVDERKGHK